MNVFLMYPDKVFRQITDLPVNEKDLIQDLELNVLFETMAQGDPFLFEVAQKAVLTSLREPELIRYRQDILKDCLNHPDIVRKLYNIPIQAIERNQRHWLGVFTRNPSGILSGARSMLKMYFDLLKDLKEIADSYGKNFESPGFQRFFAMIQQELSNDYLDQLAQNLKWLFFQNGVLISAELGKGNEGTNYTLRKAQENGQSWLSRIINRKPSYSFTLHPRDDHSARALGELKDKGINLTANAVAQSAEHIKSFFNVLRDELGFYIGCLNLSEQLDQLGEPFTIPALAPVTERQLTATGLYDIALALTMKKQVIGNDLQADNKSLVMITGANQGGKSTFLRSIGSAQLMMQSGMFVPAISFHANICRGLYTHYKREEDVTMRSGKFDEELSRMSDIVDQITPNSMVLFNESFSATNDREGSEIARQITSALLDMNIKVFYVTHLYEFANDYYSQGLGNAIFLRAERKTGGERTFKLIEGKPLQTSFGEDIYTKIFGSAM